MAGPALFDARAYLQGLVGQTILTITGKPNTILAVRDNDVFVRTQDTANPGVGEPVPIQWVQDAGDTLYERGRIGINTTEATHRSAFIGAVLSSLPGAVALRQPARVDLEFSPGNAPALPTLEPGRVYSWDELADAFGFKAGIFSVGGGMVPSATTNSLLLITHPAGARTFDYHDHWDGADLIYTGRGKRGDQLRSDARNLDVAENRRPLFVFEAAGSRLLRFLGRAVNVEERIGRAPDDNGEMRNVLLFRLRFEGEAVATQSPPSTAAADAPARTARPFRDEPPAPPSAAPGEAPDPEVVAAKREQANQDHHAIVRALNALLHAVGCDEVREIPGAIDLWGDPAERFARDLRGQDHLRRQRALADSQRLRAVARIPDGVRRVWRRPVPSRRSTPLGAPAETARLTRRCRARQARRRFRGRQRSRLASNRRADRARRVGDHRIARYADVYRSGVALAAPASGYLRERRS